MRILCFLCAGMQLAGCSNSPGIVSEDRSSGSEVEAVLQVVEDVLDAVTNRDVATWRRLLHEDGVWYVQKIDSLGTVSLSVSTTEQRIEQLANTEPGITDRIFKPEVRVSGPIATFWARFEARDPAGELIACGVDAFQLVKTGSRWRITNIMYTEHSTCTD